jgi:hypothetical protein
MTYSQLKILRLVPRTPLDTAANASLLLSVEQIEIRCAGGAIRLGDRLTLVMQVRECITPGCCLFFHMARVICRVRVYVIAVDGIDSDATGTVLGSYARELFADVNNKRTDAYSGDALATVLIMHRY